jgi:hypothetical protein
MVLDTIDSVCSLRKSIQRFRTAGAYFIRNRAISQRSTRHSGFAPRLAMLTERSILARRLPDECTSSSTWGADAPEKSEGRWGQGLTAEKMKGCVWSKPKAVARIDFAEWTGADKLRHTKFIALRDDKDPRKVVKETK